MKNSELTSSLRVASVPVLMTIVILTSIVAFLEPLVLLAAAFFVLAEKTKGRRILGLLFLASIAYLAGSVISSGQILLPDAVLTTDPAGEAQAMANMMWGLSVGVWVAMLTGILLQAAIRSRRVEYVAVSVLVTITALSAANDFRAFTDRPLEDAVLRASFTVEAVEHLKDASDRARESASYRPDTAFDFALEHMARRMFNLDREAGVPDYDQFLGRIEPVTVR